MVHTYEVLVDIKECVGQAESDFRNLTKRYEVHAKSQERAGLSATLRAKHDYPGATEYDSRVIGFLK